MYNLITSEKFDGYNLNSNILYTKKNNVINNIFTFDKYEYNTQIIIKIIAYPLIGNFNNSNIGTDNLYECGIL